MQEKKSDESVSEEPTSVEATAPLNIYIFPSTGRGIRPEMHENALSERRQETTESGSIVPPTQAGNVWASGVGHEPFSFGPQLSSPY